LLFVRGVGNAAGLTPGYHFALKHHYRRDANGKYLVTQVHHSASAGGYRAWDESAALDYRVEFRAIPHDTPFRASRRTPRPVMFGSQTALVVGPAGEEVHVDSHGRIKVQFYWDRDGKKDEKSSCWVRVSTPWGGKGYGSVSIPRIGNEVVIAFEEGDPDRPRRHLQVGELVLHDVQRLNDIALQFLHLRRKLLIRTRIGLEQPGGLNLLVSHSGSLQAVRDHFRVVAAVGDKMRVLGGTDCGFDSTAGQGRVAADVAWAKLRALVEGARIASERLY